MVTDATQYALPKLKMSSPRLSYLLGGDGIVEGRIHRLIGPESSGKSTLCTYIGTQFQQKPDHNVVVYLDYERTFIPKHAAEMGLDLSNALTDDEGKFIWLKPDNIEEGGIILEELIKTGRIGLIIFDSEATAAPKGVLEGEFNKADFGSAAKSMKNFINRFTPLLDNYGATMLVISQERAQQNTMSHAIAYTGGFALKFAASTLTRIRKVEDIKDKDGKLIGIHQHLKNMKNKCTIPFREIDMDLYFCEHDGKPAGFDVETEYVDFIKDLAGQNAQLDNMMAYSGGYYKSSLWGVSLHGRNELVNWLHENQDKFDLIKELIDKVISGNLTTDRSEAEAALEDEEIAASLKETEEANSFNGE